MSAFVIKVDCFAENYFSDKGVVQIYTDADVY